MLPFCRASASRLSRSTRSSYTKCSSLANDTKRGRSSGEEFRHRHTIKVYSTQCPPNKVASGHLQRLPVALNSPKSAFSPLSARSNLTRDNALLSSTPAPGKPWHAMVVVPGKLDLSIAGLSLTKDESSYQETRRILQAITKGLKARIQSVYAAKEINPKYNDQISALRKNPERILEIWAAEPEKSQKCLSRAILSAMLHQTKSLCQILPVILGNEPRSFGLDRRSLDLIRYLYHQCLLEGLLTANITPKFYECLIQLFKTRGSAWTSYVISGLPHYFLFDRCPPSLREGFQAYAALQSDVGHFEEDFRQVHLLAKQGKLDDAIICFTTAQRYRHARDTVENYNAFCTLLEAAEDNFSTDEITRLFSELLDVHLLSDMSIWPVLMSFIVRIGLNDVLLHIMRLLENNRNPIWKVHILRAMRSLSMNDDALQMSQKWNDDDVVREESYSVMSSMQSIKSSLKRAGQGHIFRDLLRVVQQHTNVEVLVMLGVAESVESPDRPYLDGLMVSTLLAQYFKDNEYSHEAVMSVYNRFKQLCTKGNAEVFRMAAFPGPDLYNVFIMAFSHMSKEHLGDALDVLAELIHHHDPIKNQPGSIPKVMTRPKLLHAGPNAFTYGYMISAFVRHGQLQAAERCLAEIWKSWPHHWGGPCDTLIHAYVEIGKTKEAGFLLTRKVNAGYEITDRTLRALSPRMKVREKESSMSMIQAEEF